MSKNYSLEQIYVGELYLYTHFAGFISKTYNPKMKEMVKKFSKTGAIDFDKDPLSKYIDWEKGIEYTGFLTMFYKQGNKYVCLHDGKTYEQTGGIFIENLVPLSELIPKINTELPKNISIPQALQLFDTLFKKNFGEIALYDTTRYDVIDFYVGDVILRERKQDQTSQDTKIEYIDLPRNIMLAKSNLLVSSYRQMEYINRVYRCLFLHEDIDIDKNLYNINNHEFYSSLKDVQSITTFRDYINDYGLRSTQKTLSIPKALKLLKKTIE